MLVILLAFPFLREKLTVKKLCSIFISFGGIMVIVTHGRLFTLNLTSLQGDLLALGGASVFALFSVLGKKYHDDQVVSVFLSFVTALVFITPTLVLFSSLRMPSWHIWLWLFLNGFVVNGVSYIFWLKALEYGDTSVTSNALYLTPFLSLVSIALFLGERILLSSRVGLIIIVVGIVLQSVNWRQRGSMRNGPQEHSFSDQLSRSSPLTHPLRISMWKAPRRLSDKGSWIEPMQGYRQEYANDVAHLAVLHKRWQKRDGQEGSLLAQLRLEMVE